MQTVQFQCGYCGNLMAVAVDYLGQPVRCPHCQQIVVAPAVQAPPNVPSRETEVVPPPDEAGDPYDNSPFQSLKDSEDIFHQTKETEDVLFGSESPALDLPSAAELPDMKAFPDPLEPEVPPSSPIPPLELEFPGLPVSLPPDQPEPVPDLLLPTPEANGHNVFSGPAEPQLSDGPAHPWVDHPVENPAPSVAMEPLTGSVMEVRKPRDISSGKGLFLPLVIIPLVLYAVLATAFAGYLYLREQSRLSPFDQIPDVEGDTPGVRRTKQALRFDRQFATQPLPDRLIVPLGESLQIGALEVTPLRVERRKIALLAEGANPRPEPSPYDALVLHLRLKNLSEEYAFTPLDNYFDRRWEPRDGTYPPLTVLMAGKEVFFGGPAEWAPLNRGRFDRTRREWIEGRKNVDSRGLEPGEQTESFVCTNAWDPRVSGFLFGQDENGKDTLKPYQGKLLWRVQVRRGLINHRGRSLPATAVLGVSFTEADYQLKQG